MVGDSRAACESGEVAPTSSGLVAALHGLSQDRNVLPVSATGTFRVSL